ncbi:MAG: ABC transporter substrate-binding protein [Candidatus Meridianibacter frigidus]|nr:MAG: ABC transporter substrate-binding protein [Candidatus Eremiobacteraeota bacterium]
MRAIALVLLLAVGCRPAADAAGAPVTVVYAGSLARIMEQRIGPAFSASCGCEYRGEGKGSVALANLIEAGLRSPDVFISADTRVLDRLLHPRQRRPYIDGYTRFASARMILGYSRRSRFAREFASAKAGKLSIARLLMTPGLRIGRTDPKLDPKGYRAILTVLLAARYYRAPALPRTLGDLENAEQIFPEETLLVRLESGDLDVAFLYSTESAESFGSLELPPQINLGDPALAREYQRVRIRVGNTNYSGAPILYALAILKAAPNPPGARSLVRYLLQGPGRALLQRSGMQLIL